MPTSSPTTRRLDRALTSLQAHANLYTSSGRLAVCRELVLLEAQPDVWDVQYDDFKLLIEDNRLCDWRVYEAFKVAAGVFRPAVMDATGFWACLRLATITDTALRHQITREIRQWQVTEGLFTSYQAVDVWLRNRFPKQFPAKEKSHVITKLEKEIQVLRRAYDLMVSKYDKARADLLEVRRGQHA
jgi:hypothetical protein